MFKRISLVLLSVFLIFALCACHAKDEIAVTVADVEITSGAYANMLLYADTEAKSKVEENLTSQGATDLTNVKYFSQKIDGVIYTDWVKQRAIEHCKRFAMVEIKAKELGITLSEEEIQSVTATVYNDWYGSGFNTIYEQNGVGYNTYLNYNLNNRLGFKVFEKVYGVDGEKAADKTAVLDAMYENFEIANILEIDIKDMSKTEIAENKAVLDGYADRLNKGESFETIYVEHYELKDHTHEGTQEDAPKDLHATLIGSDETSYSDADFNTIKKMSVGEIKVIEDSDNDVLRLVIRKDIKADEYYEENLYGKVLYMLYDEDYEKYLAELYEKLDTKINDYAVNNFKVKKIKYQ